MYNTKAFGADVICECYSFLATLMIMHEATTSCYFHQKSSESVMIVQDGKQVHYHEPSFNFCETVAGFN